MEALDYARELIAFDSVSSRSNSDVSRYLEERLQELGFRVERVEYTDEQGVPKSNVIAKLGGGRGGMAYFGHSDVVPADNWSRPQGPFEPTVDGDRLYGRGSCDMKGSVACMLAAAARFESQELNEPVYFVCTADEEVGYGGARQVVRRSQLFAEMRADRTRGIVGEPTRLEVVYAHKGTYGFRAVARGRAAHSSTREGVNANLAMIPFLQDMKAIHDETEQDPAWQDDRFDPPTISWNIGVNDQTRAVNITAPQSICTVYFRPMPNQHPECLVERAEQAARRFGLEFQQTVAGAPFLVDPDSRYVRELLQLAGRQQPRTVCYGTDGGTFRDLDYLAVIGPGDVAQAHTADEWIALDQLEQATGLYARLIQHWCCR